MKKMKNIEMKSWVADNGKIPLFFTFLFLILTGIMVNRRYEKKKEVKFGNGTGSPFLLITSFLPVLRLILISIKKKKARKQV